MEDGILTMLDASDVQDSSDDWIAFLDAVRASSIVPQHGKVPSSKVFREIFRMLRTGKSLEVIMASFKLLVDLNKHFPRVYLSAADDSNTSSDSPPNLIVAEKVWSPFIVSAATEEQPDQPLDPSKFHTLVEKLADLSSETEFQASNLKALQKLLLFQYLVDVFEGDFLPRNATMTWNMQRESLLNILVGSRKINYKNLMKDCITIISELPQLQHEFSKYLELQMSTESQLPQNCHTALSLALLEAVKNMCVSMNKLLVMIMDLDMSKKKADIEGHTTRADGLRKPLMEIILDDLAYNKDTVPLFLKVFSEPKLKLEIVVLYLWKHITKPSVRTRRSNGSTEDATFHAALKCFSNKTGTKGIMKKIGADILQFLLAHGFQAQLSILSEGNADDNMSGDTEGRASTLVDLCQTFISAFESLRSTDEHMEILPIGKEALFTAATIISMKS